MDSFLSCSHGVLEHIEYFTNNDIRENRKSLSIGAKIRDPGLLIYLELTRQLKGLILLAASQRSSFILQT